MNKQQWEELANNIYNFFSAIAYDLEMDGASLLGYSYAHIVWEDGNYLPHHIDFCINACDKNEDEFSAQEVNLVKASLLALKVLPEYQQSWWDED